MEPFERTRCDEPASCSHSRHRCIGCCQRCNGDRCGRIAESRSASIPHDVAVVGFDTGIAATCDPPPTSVRQPFHDISGEVVRLLLDEPEGKSIRVPTLLNVRESSLSVT
ncbi:substrate-binding domain-containing protein [Microbacterium panaciterrae]|uniref:substrate-binding domain-containing protein n=1 Tax=Microbacterium panaciterrae TaxID=985759 RepID=UPI003CD064F7